MKIFDVILSVLVIGFVLGGPYTTFVHESIHMIQCQKSNVTYACSYEPFVKFNQIRFKTIESVTNRIEMEKEAIFLSIMMAMVTSFSIILVLKAIKDNEKWWERG